MTDVERIATILASSELARENNEYLLARFYDEQYGIEKLYDIVEQRNVKSIQSVLRMTRKLKSEHKELRGSEETQNAKLEEQGKYKEIGLSIPWVEKVF